MGRGQRLALVVAAAAVAALAFVALRPDDDDPAAPKAGSTVAQTRPSADGSKPQPKPRFERITLAAGGVRGGERRITVRKGETARIEVASDAPDEIHLHGYDVTKKVAPGRPAQFVLEAKIEGVFEIEAHDLGHLVIGELLVEP